MTPIKSSFQTRVVKAIERLPTTMTSLALLTAIAFLSFGPKKEAVHPESGVSSRTISPVEKTSLFDDPEFMALFEKQGQLLKALTFVKSQECRFWMSKELDEVTLKLGAYL